MSAKRKHVPRRPSAVAVVIAAALLAACAKPASEAATSAAASASPPPPGKFYPSQGHQHVDDAALAKFHYNSSPPTSGPHKETFTGVFISTQPIPPYVQVHLLEHGGVLLQYSCDCPDIASALGSIAYEYDKRLYAPEEPQPTPQEVAGAEEAGYAVIVAPYPKMKAKIAATAWTRLQTFDHVDKAAIVTFINAYLHNQANASQ